MMTVAQYSELEIPRDHDAERAVLGAILIDGEAIERVAQLVTPDAFDRTRHRWAFEAMLEIHIAGGSIDPVTVARRLADRDRLEEAGGLSYLGELIRVTPTSVNADVYAEIVAEKATLRQLADAGAAITRTAMAQGSKSAEAVERSREILEQVMRDRPSGGPRRLSDHLSDFLAWDADNTERPASLGTGFQHLDLLTGGLEPGDLVVAGGRPSTGKTSLTLQMARDCMEQGRVPLIFSMEMTGAQVALRMVAAEAGVPTIRLKNGLYSEAEEERIIDAVGRLSGPTTWLDDDGGYSTDDIARQAGMIQRAHGLDLIIIDYIQLVRPPVRSQNQVQDMTQVSRALKTMAVAMGVTVIACSQLNRATESRSDHRPQLSDLRDSGSIEQDADIVFLLYREDRYFTRHQWQTARPGERYPKGQVELQVAKHRNGPTGSVMMYFDEATTTFHEAEDSEAEAA